MRCSNLTRSGSRRQRGRGRLRIRLSAAAGQRPSCMASDPGRRPMGRASPCCCRLASAAEAAVARPLEPAHRRPGSGPVRLDSAGTCCRSPRSGRASSGDARHGGEPDGASAAPPMSVTARLPRGRVLPAAAPAAPAPRRLPRWQERPPLQRCSEHVSSSRSRIAVPGRRGPHKVACATIIACFGPRLIS